MIKLFRQLRKSMINQNRTKKYLLYAVGEIILVVIGILIALQINNWNEQRKASHIELQQLQSFKDGLEQDLSDIDFNIRYTKRGIRALDTILSHLQSDASYQIDSIARLFSDAMTPTRFQYSTSAFETLKSSGINTIRSKDLRNDIIGVYDSEYNFFLAFQEEHLTEINRGYTQVFSSRFEESYNYDTNKADFPGELMPLDFNALKTDQEFLYYLKSIRNKSNLLIEFHYGKLRRKVVSLLDNIETEMDKFEA